MRIFQVGKDVVRFAFVIICAYNGLGRFQAQAKVLEHAGY